MQKNKNTKSVGLNIHPSKLTFWKSLPFVKLFYLSLIISALNILTVISIKRFLPPQIPLYYGLAEDESQLASSSSLIVTGVLSLAVVVINGTAAALLKREFIQKILVLTSFAVSFMTEVTTVKIILLVGSFH